MAKINIVKLDTPIEGSHDIDTEERAIIWGELPLNDLGRARWLVPKFMRGNIVRAG